MRWSERRAAARAVLEGHDCVHPASVHEPVAARIAEDLGYELGMFAGSTGSLAVLGAPDIILLTLTEFAEQARRINRAASRLPLVVDADHGYGNALNVMRTVEELEVAGVAALSIEDTALPRPFGTEKPVLIPLDEGVAKMRAAVAARDDASLVIFARTGAVSITGLEDALARVRAYNHTGTDGIFLTGVTKRAELDALAAEAKLPLVLGTLSDEISDRAYLASRGVRIALQGHLPFQAAIQAIHATLKALREGTPPAQVGGTAPKALREAAMREADYAELARRFLG
ncbi:isocitrate lyase/PEP mutase family protein [Roseococcus thiosulfatophilus]|uniref:isocitrate lyase/PEP mutase family protein n=1 Tax=Roseococcus thiosulfatophilus TaxID=35813 RepID=UPI001A90B31E|nr:isocitrate lyase/PEP mutase family protein [Roseococcus thiosulfatophilus]